MEITKEDARMNEALTALAGLVCLVGFGWGLVGLAVFAVDEVRSRR